MTAKQIQTARRRLNLTQEAFARILGVSYVTVNRWEKGKHRPSPVWVEKINALLERKS